MDSVSVHDSTYLREKGEWKRKLAAAHPDAGGNAFTFRSLISKRKAWEKEHLAWYTARGLTPPDDGASPEPITADVETLIANSRGTVGRTRRRVLAYIESHPEATNQQIADAIGSTLTAVEMVKSRERKGYKPREDFATQRLIRILADGQPRTRMELVASLGMTDGAVNMALSRLRRRGFDLASFSRGRGIRYYQLMTGNLHAR